MRLSEVTGLLDSWYPPSWAEGWDRVGLVCGDPGQEVRRILFAVDPVERVVDEALEFGADLVVVHHPLLLTPVSSVAATTAKGAVVHRLVRAGVALFTAHTNADVPRHGVNDSIARALGLQDCTVLHPTDVAGLDKVVTFVPAESAETVRQALAAAGAGRIGAYDSCSFTGTGEGRFRPLEGADPVIGAVGRLEVVPEVRVEVVAPRNLRSQVVRALLDAHPYEEPAYDVLELAELPHPPATGSVGSTRGHGRVGRLAEAMTLQEFAGHVAASLPETAHGVRVAGDPEQLVETVGVGAGSGESLMEDARRAGCDVFVTSDLKHHRAGEFLEEGGPALIDVAHWAAEWTWLPVVEARVREAVGDRRDTVETRVSTIVTDPWSFRV